MSDKIVPLSDLEATLEHADRAETVEEADRRMMYLEVNRMLQRAAERELAHADRDKALIRLQGAYMQLAENVHVLAMDRAIDQKQIEKLTMSVQSISTELNVLREQQVHSKARVDQVVSRQEELAGLLDRMRARIIEWDTEKSEP